MITIRTYELPFLSGLNFGGSDTRWLVMVFPHCSIIITKEAKKVLITDNEVSHMFCSEVTGQLGFICINLDYSGCVNFNHRFQILSIYL